MQTINEDLRRPAFNEHVSSDSVRSVPAWWWGFKRATDIAIGAVCLVIAIPILVFAACAIVAVSPGPPFYKQKRVGRDGRVFDMFKLRTMIRGAHAMRNELMHLNEVEGPVFKIRDDPRLHPIGAFLRRSSIDELPNLINVLKGDICLVGPRPALPSEVEHYDARARRRLAVPQGMTCLWQISGRSRVSFDEWMTLDNLYIDTWSPWSDLVIILKTVPAVLRRDGAR